MTLEFTKEALNDLVFWKSANAKTAEKIRLLLHEIATTPYSGSGKPEPLRANLTGFYSRRISLKDRIVYTVDEPKAKITIISLRGHYS